MDVLVIVFCVAAPATKDVKEYDSVAEISLVGKQEKKSWREISRQQPTQVYACLCLVRHLYSFCGVEVQRMWLAFAKRLTWKRELT
jgi:hypothetical protein